MPPQMIVQLDGDARFGAARTGYASAQQGGEGIKATNLADLGMIGIGDGVAGRRGQLHPTMGP